MIKTYLDANILIAGFRSNHLDSQPALSVLGDPGRIFVASHYLRLEILRKPLFYRREDEIAFMEAYFSTVSHWVSTNDTLVAKALKLAADLDLGTMDALHAACALQGGAEEFITLERSTKSICRIPGLYVVSLHPEATTKPA